jgi:phosphoserine phosphatase
MDQPSRSPRLSSRDIEPILAVTRSLAAPFDLTTMLATVIDAATQVLDADRATVWLYDSETDQLVLEVATDIQPVRVSANTGIVGSCARSREVINVPDCYADPRFNPEIDKRSNYRTRCMLTLPLIDHKDVLVGVLQVLNKHEGVFDRDDEALARALAAQCAVALQRVRMTEALIEGERMRQELELARVVQQGTLPAAMPVVPGYDVHGAFQPADLTGGDTFDAAVLDQGLLLVLGDATGHGIAPALHVTQMHAMLRMAFRMGADLDTAFVQVNNQLADSLPDDRFITAFIGILDPATHRLRFHSGGQGPILIFDATSGTCQSLNPTSFPLSVLPLASVPAAVTVDMKVGDMLIVLSDGIFEYHDAQREEFGVQRVVDIVRSDSDRTMAQLADALLASVRQFANGAVQEDDMTLVLVKRTGEVTTTHRAFDRSFDALEEIFDFTSYSTRWLRLDPRVLPVVDLGIEELFTNAVKYSTMSTASPEIGLRRIPGGVEVTLTDHDVDLFDVTKAPAVDVDAPIENREPGGLGLHLVRKMADSIDYHYDSESRRSQTVFTKTFSGHTDADSRQRETGQREQRDQRE